MDELLQEIARLSGVLAKDPNSRLFYPLAEEYLKNNMLEEAIQILTDGLTRYPDFFSARVSLGKAYFEQGKIPEAQKEFEQVLKGHPDNLMALKKLAVIYRQQGQLDEANRCCQALVAAGAGDPEINKMLQEFEASAAKERMKQDTVDLSSAEAGAGRFTRGVSETPLSEPAPEVGVKTEPMIDLARLADMAPEIEVISSVSPAPVDAPPEIEVISSVPFEPIDPPVAKVAPPVPPRADQEDDAAPEELVSPTLAQLYFRQGHYEQAVRVYDQLLRREPKNESYRKAHQMALTLLEGQGGSSASAASAPSPADPPGGASTEPAKKPGNGPAIGRLQGWLNRLQQERRRRAS